MMESIDVTIEITRHDHRLASVKAIMPTWNRVCEDGTHTAKLPFLGLETYGNSETDLDLAVEEAFTCFCLAAEKYGLGLESELEFMGWKKSSERTENHSVLSNLPNNNPAFESMLETGETRAFELDMSSSMLVTA